MSRTIGNIFIYGKTLFFRYEGNCDLACTGIFESYEEAWNGDHSTCCNAPDCNKQKVTLHSHYGGLKWESEICMSCMAITGNLGPGDISANQYA